MTRDRRGFQYALEPVRSLTEWELNDIARALASLNANTNTQQDRVNGLSHCFAAARSDVIIQRQSQRSLDIDAQRVAHAYMMQVQQQLVTENEKLRQLQRDRDEMFAQLNEKRKFADSLDRNKESVAEEYDRNLAKLAYAQADDSWLQRLHWKTNRDRD